MLLSGLAIMSCLDYITAWLRTQTMTTQTPHFNIILPD